MTRRSGDPLASLDITARSGKGFVPFLRRYVPRATGLVRTRLRSLSLALVGDASMSRLHRQFMNIDGPTDVLTFELDHDARGAITAGEIVICVPQAMRQAARHRTSVRNELLLYAIHGLLHLSGYDDLTDAGYRAMHREEDRILTALKIGPVFSPVGSVAGAGRLRKKDGRSR